ncbi:MAG TPA: TM2 domain-containing protein [Sediminispirochaeta sp.]|nr:TM2 domain-containing protein [Sediminispirochaeta sp.]
MYSIGLAYVLWFLSGFGAMGFHRFYMGKIGTGLLYIFTGGLFGIGSIYDFITLPLQVREANLQAGWREALYGNTAMRTVGGHREERKQSLESIILRTAKKNSGVANPSEVALESNRSLDEAKAALEKLVEKGYAELRVSRTSGNLLYFFPDFSPDGKHPDVEDF